MHKKPFVSLAYRKIMLDHLPLRELSRRVKAAEVLLGTPVRVGFGGMARDREGQLLDLTHGGWDELQVGRYPGQCYFPLLGPGEPRVIRPEQDVWDHLVLFQPINEEE
jgi:hypothetical protein